MLRQRQGTLSKKTSIEFLVTELKHVEKFGLIDKVYRPKRRPDYR